MIVWKILSRVGLLIVAFVISLWAAEPFEIYLKTSLGYQESGGFFGFSFSGALLGVALSWLFLNSILFNFLGKKIDFVFLGVVFLVALAVHFQTPNVAPVIYLNLFIVGLIGSIIGFVLKLARQKFFGNKI